ncbi:MAG: hypothetical protein Q9162_004007 [Coniocarpon cinnabarinum]
MNSAGTQTTNTFTSIVTIHALPDKPIKLLLDFELLHPAPNGAPTPHAVAAQLYTLSEFVRVPGTKTTYPTLAAMWDMGNGLIVPNVGVLPCYDIALFDDQGAQLARLHVYRAFKQGDTTVVDFWRVEHARSVVSRVRDALADEVEAQ